MLETPTATEEPIVVDPSLSEPLIIDDNVPPTITKDDLKPILDRLLKIEEILNKPLPTIEDKPVQTEEVEEPVEEPEEEPEEVIYQMCKDNSKYGAKFLMLLVISFMCMMLLNMFDMFNYHNVLMLLVISYIISSVF